MTKAHCRTKKITVVRAKNRATRKKKPKSQPDDQLNKALEVLKNRASKA